jgi:hypothetical protein
MGANVDSSAMLLAAETFREENPELWKQLGMRMTAILHGPNYDPLPTHLPLKIIRCPNPTCKRCNAGMGGYTFRWLSPHWAERYEKFRAPMTWASGDPEGMGIETYGPDFTGSLVCAGGQMASDREESNTAWNDPTETRTSLAERAVLNGLHVS